MSHFVTNSTICTPQRVLRVRWTVDEREPLAAHPSECRAGPHTGASRHRGPTTPGVLTVCSWGTRAHSPHPPTWPYTRLPDTNAARHVMGRRLTRQPRVQDVANEAASMLHLTVLGSAQLSVWSSPNTTLLNIEAPLLRSRRTFGCHEQTGRFRYIACVKCPYKVAGKASVLRAGKRAPG